ncbi:hypothetical protein F2Q69_00007514 [Brassica cretica]|uniref:Uncharacterized protein n=1 Tax=Brassica cretica TaxID=69181 RepID=A0A8S9PEK9_BRACR|nr:hypothetical protein F2Q69_00007514 [Brassica cretica]
MSTHTLQAQDGEVLLLYPKEQKHTGSAVLVQRAEILLIRQRYKGHWQGRQRSSPASGNLHVSEGSTPKPSGSKRISSTNSGFIGTKPTNLQKDLRPAKSTRNCRTTRPTKVLLPQSCPIDLEGTPNGSTEGNECYLDNSPHPIDIESGPSPEDKVPKDKSTGPTRSEHEALRSLRFQRRITRDYEFLHDVRRYLTVVRQRIGLHASSKGLVPPKERMRKIAVFTRLLPSTELLHPRIRVYALQKIILQPISNHGGT